MSVGLVGRKCGMTRVFTDAGESIPVTVIEVTPNRVAQVKTTENDSYRAIQVTAGQKRASRVSKPMAGHFAKAGVEAGDLMNEYRLDEGEMDETKPGDQLTVELFEAGQKVDVRGISKGKGFAGAVKRYHFKMQDATHGNSLSHRALGSVGQCQTPGRVFKGKKMAGQMGNVRSCVQNQEVVRVDLEKHIILVKGTVPGAPGGAVVIMPSVKHKKESK